MLPHGLNCPSRGALNMSKGLFLACNSVTVCNILVKLIHRYKQCDSILICLSWLRNHCAGPMSMQKKNNPSLL